MSNGFMTHSRSRLVTSAHVQTTREQPQQQRFLRYRLTSMKCPRLFSHEMTGQVDSGVLINFSVSSCCLLLLASSVLFSGRVVCDTVFALPATLSTAFSLDGTPTNARRITLQPILSVATRPTLYMRRLAPHSTLAFPKHHASSSHREIHCLYLAGKLAHVMDVYFVFHVQFEVLFANGIDLHLCGSCDTVQANRGFWHTGH